MGEIEKQGITKNRHAYIHTWLRRKFGPANKCENKNCQGKSKFYQWSLLHGKLYEQNRNNFWMLCASCHAKYDFNEDERKYLRVFSQERKDKIGASNLGKKRNEEQRKAISERIRGENNPMFGVSLTGVNSPLFGRKLKKETRKKIFEKKASITFEQYQEIKNMHINGIEQKKISEIFKLSRATICRIVNNKRYTLW